MINKINKLLLFILLLTNLQKNASAQSFTCNTPNNINSTSSPTQNFAPQNTSICTDPENYIPSILPY